MAKARAIRKRLKAIKNIRKITRTMELIATARFKKAMDRATAAAAYTRKIAELAADLSHAGSDFSHPLLEVHDPSQKGVLLILTSNRGLCGGYNAGVLKHAQQRMRDARDRHETLMIEVSGKRGLNFLKFQKAKIDESFTHFEDKPAFDEVDVLANRFIDLYVRRKIDWVDVAYVRFQSVARQMPMLERLLPFSQGTEPEKKADAGSMGGKADIQYEFLPSAREILEEIVPAAFKARLFKCFLDAAVSEQVARMVAMKGATENAVEIIKDLSQTYNRARQSQITSELSEIIGGAAALG